MRDLIAQSVQAISDGDAESPNEALKVGGVGGGVGGRTDLEDGLKVDVDAHTPVGEGLDSVVGEGRSQPIGRLARAAREDQRSGGFQAGSDARDNLGIRVKQ